MDHTNIDGAFVSSCEWLVVHRLLAGVQRSGEASTFFFVPVEPGKFMVQLALSYLDLLVLRGVHVTSCVRKAMSDLASVSPVEVIVYCMCSILFNSLKISDRFAGSVVIRVSGLCSCDCETNMVGFLVQVQHCILLQSVSFSYAYIQHIRTYMCSRALVFRVNLPF